MTDTNVDKPAILAVTDRLGDEPHNGSQVFANALLTQLASWYDLRVVVPEGQGGDWPVIEVPKDIDVHSKASATAWPDISLIYNLGATSFACRASEWAARLLPNVPLVNHFQINLACYAEHQEVDSTSALSFADEQARVSAIATCNLFPSHSELALATQFYPKTLADHYVVPNPFVAADYLTPAPKREAFTFFAAGRFSDVVKGADLLYRAFANLIEDGASAVLDVVSDSDRFSPLLRYLPESAWKRDDWMARDALHARMRAASVVVVPSRYEPFGLVALEALALGKPVIATAVGGLQEIVHHGATGWLSPAHEGSRGLCVAMADALDAGSEVLAQMGSVGSQMVLEEHSLERIARLVCRHLDNARCLGTSTVTRQGNRCS